LLVREGWPVNCKRVQRLYREAVVAIEVQQCLAQPMVGDA
jgi:hypothetical protein